MKPVSKAQPAGHVAVPAATISALSMLLVVGLHGLGLLARINEGVVRLMEQSIRGGFPHVLPLWAVWTGTAILALGLSFAILTVPATWRRLVLWISTLVILGAWGPVLAVAAHAPEIAAPWIACFWSGFCAIIYASNHGMACDLPSPTESELAENSHETR